MNLKKVVTLSVVGLLVLCIVLGINNWGFADSSGPLPGSELDPIVTKSYVDQIAATLKAYFDEAISRDAGNKFKLVTLKPGQKLLAQQGTEIILRAGKAAVVATASGGLSDITKGSDIGKGNTVPPNHLLIVPRSDGRGLKANSKVIIMIRGEFTVE